MKVFQAPIEIAGQMGLLAKGLQPLGHEVESYNVFHTYLGYNKNIQNVSLEELELKFQRSKSDFQVFHFHYGTGFSGTDEEFRYGAEHGKVAIMHYWGNDVRAKSLAIEHNPYAALIEEFQDDAAVTDRLSRQSRYLPACIVQDFEVVPYVTPYYNRVYVLPITIDLSGMTPQFPRGKGSRPPLILHAPTSPHFKGTAYIEDTLDRLQKNGYSFRYQRIQEMPHEEAIRHYASADIVIDQILCGSHGLFAVEAMAWGKPVVSFIREDLKPRFPDELSIVSANPATLYRVVANLLMHPEQWEQLGRRGRHYVEKVHALPVVADALNQIYQREAMVKQAGEDNRGQPMVIHMLKGKLLAYPIDPITRRVGLTNVFLPPISDTAQGK